MELKEKVRQNQMELKEKVRQNQMELKEKVRENCWKYVTIRDFAVESAGTLCTKYELFSHTYIYI